MRRQIQFGCKLTKDNIYYTAKFFTINIKATKLQVNVCAQSHGCR